MTGDAVPDPITVPPRSFIVFDTETTGYPPAGRLVEIGAIKVRGNAVVERFHSLLFPECPIPAEARAVHGIDDEIVAAAPTAQAVVPEFLRWTEGLPLIAHNAPFDAAVVAAECVRHGFPVPDNPLLCTLAASRKILRHQASHALPALVRELGIPALRHHRAADDAEQTLNLLWHLVRVAGEQFNARTLGKRGRLADYRPERPRIPASRLLLWEAATAGEAVDLRYFRPDQRLQQLRVSPRFFYRKSRGVWMEALCHSACYYRSYQLERIVEAHPCPGAPPAAVRRGLAGRAR